MIRKFAVLKWIYVTVLLAGVVDAQAAGSKCDTFRTKGWWKKAYTKKPKYGSGSSGGGVLPALDMLTSTSDYEYHTETTTSSVDPAYTSRHWTSTSQSTSSWGACSMLGSAEDMRELRELYYAQNKDQVIKHMALGEGEHLEVMAFFGRCDQPTQLEFNKAVQSNFGELLPLSDDTEAFMDKFDAVLRTELSCNIG